MTPIHNVARTVRGAASGAFGLTALISGWLLVVSPGTALGATAAAQRPVGWNLDLSPPPAFVQSRSDTVPGSNTIIDLIYPAPDLWTATARGVSHVTLPGDDWTTYGTEDGLGGPEIPALGVFRSGIWAATSHLQKLDISSVARSTT